MFYTFQVMTLLFDGAQLSLLQTGEVQHVTT